jgi:hypothetical protein
VAWREVVEHPEDGVPLPLIKGEGLPAHRIELGGHTRRS